MLRARVASFLGRANRHGLVSVQIRALVVPGSRKINRPEVRLVVDCRRRERSVGVALRNGFV